MRVLRPVVQVAALTMLDLRQQLALCHPIPLQFVSNPDARFILHTCQETLEEALRSRSVPATLHQDVQHDDILVDSTPKIAPFALNADEDLIEGPRVTRPGTTASKTVCERLTKLQAPSANALIGDDDAALRQQ
jgi:hypothetical protein